MTELSPATSRQVSSWLLGGRTGASSKAMARHLAGLGDGGRDHPSDAADFERCLGLLDAAPALRGLLPRMSGLRPQWAGLVARWDEIEVFVRRGDTGSLRDAYRLMREILDPLDDADPSVVRLGGGVSISFGR